MTNPLDPAGLIPDDIELPKGRSGSISNFLAAVSANGGMSMSNGYDVQFYFDETSNATLKNSFNKFDINVADFTTANKPGSLINLFCDEAQLPSLQFATGNVNGRYTGRGNNFYPHTKLITDFSLSWMLDANLSPYKFLVTWFNFIRGGGTPLERTNNDSVPTINELFHLKDSSNFSTQNRSYRMAYPKDYQAKLRIAKTERGANAANGRSPLVWAFTGVYPYSIDAVPLSYGSSQVTRVTANFYYDTITSSFADIRNKRG